MPSFRCMDIGMTCSFEAHSDTKEERMKIKDHAAKVHVIKEVPKDLTEKINKAIKDWAEPSAIPHHHQWLPDLSILIEVPSPEPES
jgi:predicted small metal-binding protein